MTNKEKEKSILEKLFAYTDDHNINLTPWVNPDNWYYNPTERLIGFQMDRKSRKKLISIAGDYVFTNYAQLALKKYTIEYFLKSYDAIESFAHEIGHSIMFDTRSMEDIHNLNNIREKFDEGRSFLSIEPEVREIVLSEEIGAWKHAANLLAGFGYSDWNKFSIVKERSLNTYTR